MWVCLQISTQKLWNIMETFIHFYHNCTALCAFIIEIMESTRMRWLSRKVQLSTCSKFVALNILKWENAITNWHCAVLKVAVNNRLWLYCRKPKIYCNLILKNKTFHMLKSVWNWDYYFLVRAKFMKQRISSSSLCFHSTDTQASTLTNKSIKFIKMRE